jgi:hypothetical protein
VISVPIKRFKPGLTGWGDDIEAVMVSWFDGDYMLVSDYEQALAAALDAERERGKRAARQAEDEVSNLRKRIRQAEAERDAAIERAERAERKYTEAEDAEVVTSLVVNLRAERDEWKSKFNMLNECHARTATNGAKATLDAEARAEAAEAWQRAVAKELGWCEELGEAIPDAEFMANIARTHGESHLRLEGAEAEVERLRSGSRLYETVLELEAEVERLRGELARRFGSVPMHPQDMVDLIHDTSCSCCEHDGAVAPVPPCPTCTRQGGDEDHFERHHWLCALADRMEALKRAEDERAAVINADADVADRISKALGILGPADERATNVLAEADYGSELQNFADEVCAAIVDAIAALKDH